MYLYYKYNAFMLYNKSNNSINAYLYPISIRINTPYQNINIIHSMHSNCVIIFTYI